MSEVLTANSLLYGRKLEFRNKCVDEGHFEVAEGDVNLAEKMCGAKAKLRNHKLLNKRLQLLIKELLIKKI